MPGAIDRVIENYLALRRDEDERFIDALDASARRRSRRRSMALQVNARSSIAERSLDCW